MRTSTNILDALPRQASKDEPWLTPDDVDRLVAWVKARPGTYPEWHQAWTLGANAISLRVDACDIYAAALKREGVA